MLLNYLVDMCNQSPRRRQYQQVRRRHQWRWNPGRGSYTRSCCHTPASTAAILPRHFLPWTGRSRRGEEHSRCPRHKLVNTARSQRAQQRWFCYFGRTEVFLRSRNQTCFLYLKKLERIYIVCYFVKVSLQWCYHFWYYNSVLRVAYM